MKTPFFRSLVLGIGSLFQRPARRESDSSGDRLRALTEAANDAFISADSSGLIVESNPAAQAMLGYSQAEMLGRPLVGIFCQKKAEGEGRESLPEFLVSTGLGLGAHAVEMEIRHRDGNEMPVEVSLFSWKGMEGKCFTAVIRDIGERKFFTKTLLENEHRLFQFLEVLPVGIFVLDGAGKPYYVNQTAKEILGQGVLLDVQTEGIPRAYGFQAAPSGETYPTARMPLTKALLGEKSHVEDMAVRNENETVPIQMWGAPIFGRTGQVKYAVAAFADISEQKTAQRTLQEGQRKFQAVTDTATDAIILSDGLGDIIYFNRTAGRIFGYQEGEVLGKPFTFLLPERLHRVYREGIERFAGTSEGAESASPWVELMGRRKDQTEFPMEISYSSWRTEAGSFSTKILRDVTERKQAEHMLQEREEMFRNLFEEGPIGMTLTDKDGRMVKVNQAFCRMLGYRKKELTGQPFLAFTDPSDIPVEEGLTEKMFSRVLPSYQIEKRYIDKSGETVWCKLTASVVLDNQGKPLHRLAIIENITGLKEIEEMKKDLISVVSHQLKTPVGEINGYIENMLDGVAGDLNPKQQEYLSDMREIGQDNYRLISDLLNASKIERGVISVDMKEVAARQMVEMAVRDYLESAGKKGLELRMEGLEEDVILHADRDKTVETLRNLINNALKCTDKGSITVAVRIEGEEGIIDVRDTGIGMSEEVLTRLFKKSRVLGKEASRAGAGLGLYIAKNFMKVQGGDITVISRPGEGTCFSVRLPLSKEPAAVAR